jgi:hypothetical protein
MHGGIMTAVIVVFGLSFIIYLALLRFDTCPDPCEHRESPQQIEDRAA